MPNKANKESIIAEHMQNIAANLQQVAANLKSDTPETKRPQPYGRSLLVKEGEEKGVAHTIRRASVADHASKVLT